jgi:hypothetical protein
VLAAVCCSNQSSSSNGSKWMHHLVVLRGPLEASLHCSPPRNVLLVMYRMLAES